MKFTEPSIRLRLLSLLLCLLALGSAQQVRAAQDKALKSNSISLQQAENLISESGIKMQINQIPDALIQAGRQQSGPAATFIQPLMKSMQTVFVPEGERGERGREEGVRRVDEGAKEEREEGKGEGPDGFFWTGRREEKGGAEGEGRRGEEGGESREE